MSSFKHPVRINMIQLTFSYKSWTPNGFHFQIIINILVALSESFQYLCYGTMAIGNSSNFTVLLHRLHSSESDVYRRQILMTEDDHAL